MPHLDHNGLEVMFSALASACLAQFLKLLWSVIKRKPFNFRLLVETGGMPSSHSAAMSAMATSVGLLTGFMSIPFAIALNISLVVMYDAAGVRRAAGRMAGILNRLTQELYEHHPDKLPERMRELLGHTPVEVIAGAFLGAWFAGYIHTIWA
jgi:uncharacterized protein